MDYSMGVQLMSLLIVIVFKLIPLLIYKYYSYNIVFMIGLN